MRAPLSLLFALLTLCALGCSSTHEAEGSATGREVKLPEGWAASAKVGTKAAYAASLDGQGLLGITYEITSNEAGVVAYKEQHLVGEKVMKEKLRSLQVSDYDFHVALRIEPETEVTPKGSETIEAAGIRFECSVYEFVRGKSACRVWLSPDVPAAFFGGMVRSEEREGSHVKALNLITLGPSSD